MTGRIVMESVYISLLFISNWDYQQIRRVYIVVNSGTFAHINYYQLAVDNNFTETIQ